MSQKRLVNAQHTYPLNFYSSCCYLSLNTDQHLCIDWNGHQVLCARTKNEVQTHMVSPFSHESWRPWTESNRSTRRPWISPGNPVRGNVWSGYRVSRPVLQFGRLSCIYQHFTRVVIWWTGRESNPPQVHCKCSSPSWYMPAQKTFHTSLYSATTILFRSVRRVFLRSFDDVYLVVHYNERNAYSLLYLSGTPATTRT